MKEKNIWLSSAIFIAIIFVVNLLADSFFVRFDLTADGKYSVSDVTRETLAQIEDPVTVKIFYSENFPRQLITVKQYVLDMLEEYRAYASGGLEYEFIEISGEAEEEQREAMQYGVMPVQANITQSDEIKVQTIFLGLVFLYGDQREVIPFANNIAQLEYDMTGAIKKLIAGQTPKVAWLSGHGEAEVFGNQEVDRALAEIRKNYQLTSVNLKDQDQIPDDISVALLVQPTESFDDAALYKVDQFLMRGGRLGVFTSSKIIDMANQFMPVRDNASNIFDFFKHFGFEIDRRLILDQQSHQIQAMQNMGAFRIPVAVEYPFAPRITTFDQNNPIVSRLEETGFFYLNEVVNLLEPTSQEAAFTPLLKTSNQSGYAMPDPRTQQIDIGVGREYPPFLFREGAKTVAASIQGSFSSYFGEAAPGSVEYPHPHLASTQAEVQMVVVGSGTLVNEQFMIPSALTFFLNTVDWLYDENGLISIRSKDIAPKQLDETTPGSRAIIKWTNILLAPLLIVGFGMVRWFMRRRVKALAGGSR